MAEDVESRWKVGELAKATGVTVRTLHHYDEVGLLVPAERTSGGHRLYAQLDVRRLYLILALRRLGLGLEEIASLLDDDGVSLIDTVRRHLEQVERELENQHRLHERLRQMLAALERSVEPGADEYIDALEAMSVIEATVEDVVIRVPAGEAAEPPPPLAREGYRVVVLKERGGDRVLPIWIRAHEGDLLAARLGECSQDRPMGPDLTVRLLEVGGARIERVTIESVREFTFIASITVAAGGESHEVDARPSDALNLAVRVGAPVFVTAEVIDQAGVRSGAFASLLSGEGGEHGWRSLSPEVIRSLQPRQAREGWERFTGPARHAMSSGREEAQALGHDSQAPAHLLLGLLREPEGLAPRVLGSLGVSVEGARGQLELTRSTLAPTTPHEMLLFTPEAQQVLEVAFREEPTHHTCRVGTEHLLLGLAQASPEILVAVGADPDRVRAEVRRAMA